MASTVVRFKEVTKVYGSAGCAVTALADASLELAAGARVAVTGPSGSGKTTLLHLMAGLDTPTKGVVSWPSLDATVSLRPGLVGIAFQGPSLLPPLTVVENVAFPALIAGDEQSVALASAWEMLDRMSLADIGPHLPDQLSGGQSQRVGLARALVTKPALVLADEPTGQQDHENGLRLMDFLLARVGETGATLVVATHDMKVAKLLESIWSIESGRIVTEAPYVQSVMD